MWLQDDNQHSFPIKAPEDNFLQGAKARLEKDLNLKRSTKKTKTGKNMKSSPLRTVRLMIFLLHLNKNQL